MTTLYNIKVGAHFKYNEHIWQLCSKTFCHARCKCKEEGIVYICLDTVVEPI